MNRISRLPIAEFCGRSAELDVGSSRVAVMGSAFHAMCEGDSAKIAKLLMLLSPEEVDEVHRWKKPTKVTFDDGTELSYDSAEKETEVGFDAQGRHTTGEKAIAIGHIDMSWIRHTVAYVGDIKKQRWTTLDGPDSLQLAGYGFALAAREGCTHFCPGLWYAEEGEWSWGSLVDLESSEAADLWARIVHAAMNVGGEFYTGGHCRSCYSRLRCPAYLVPVESTHALAPLAGHEVTNAQVLALLHAKQRAETTLEAVDAYLKEYARRTPIYDPETKRKYCAVQCSGRESIDVDAILRDCPDARQRGWFKKGRPYPMMRWIKT